MKKTIIVDVCVHVYNCVDQMIEVRCVNENFTTLLSFSRFVRGQKHGALGQIKYTVVIVSPRILTCFLDVLFLVHFALWCSQFYLPIIGLHTVH